MASNYFAKGLKRSALTVALGLCFAGGVQAQSSVGSIFGQTQSNQTVTITNVETGLTRNVTVGADGRFTFSQLAPGRYTVVSDGVTRNVVVNVGAGSSVNFGAGGATDLGAVTVVGAAYNANAIDVSAVQSSTVFTAEQIERIPIGRSVQSVALLAPSVVANSSYAGNAPSFGGSASSENAYYINGYGVTNPLTSIGFSTLPFDSIDQMEVLTGGYGVQYGRSTGGVISVTTKRGTNDWKFGGAVFYTPKSLRSDYRSTYYPDTGFYGPNSADKIKTDGKLLQDRSQNTLQTLQYGVHASGPIIRDRLFFYASADWTKSDQRAINTAVPQGTYGTNPGGVQPVPNGWFERDQTDPRAAVKLDWQISDNHSLEFTGIQDRTKQTQFLTTYDTITGTQNGIQSGGGVYDDKSRMYIGRYIGHFTDNLSLSVVYGKQDIEHSVDLFGYNPACPRVSGSNGANVKTGVKGSPGCQTQANSPSEPTEATRGGRIDLDWVIGDHSLRLGVDDSTAHTVSSSEYAGGFVWVYSRTANFNNPINAPAGVGAPGAAAAGNPADGTVGYFVRKQYFTNFADVESNQRAYYLEDRWQVNDNFMLSLGVRNENFTNYNGDHKEYVSQKNQWAPRVGFSWDVKGDQSLKVFGNAGRYHLILPNNVAARAAASSLYTLEYFNYTGIDPVTGAPTGLTNVPVDVSKGKTCPGNNFAIAPNLECGQAADPRTVAAKDLKPHFQDEYIIGFQHQYNATINWGMRAHWRALKSAIDDTCTTVLGGGCFTFNPGVGNTFFEDDGTGNLVEVSYTAEQLALPKLKRKYWAVDTFIERQGDKWFGRFEYSFSRNMGNTEGQLLSDIDTGGGGQSDVGQTQDWDLPSLMENAYGLLPNHRAHQIKTYGYYSVTPEFRVGGSAIITSGRPLSCTSFYPDPNADTYNGSYYHFCGMAPSVAYPNGLDYKVAPRGTTGTTGWTQQLNLNAAYVPNWADKKLTFAVDVLNVLDQQKAQYNNMQFSQDRATPARTYRQDLSYTAPRSVRFTIRYDY